MEIECSAPKIDTIIFPSIIDPEKKKNVNNQKT